MMLYNRNRGSVPAGREGLARPRYFLKIALPLALVATLVMSGCSTRRSAFQGKGSPTYSKSGPIPRGGGVYKVGKPYQVGGKWYYPQEDESYDRTGIASWYGPKFHRRMTSNGEWFDMNRISGAHPTLPLPSYARVTNLENGRSIIVRVNDRGPYADGRVIDLSRQAASVLGYIRNGTTRVRVKYAGRAPLQGDDPRIVAENRRLAALYTGRKRPIYTASFNKTSLPPRIDNEDAPPVAVITPAAVQSPATRHYVQVAAYASEQNARRARERASELGAARLVPTRIGEQIFHRVRLGPFSDRPAASKVQAQAAALGFSGARIISLRQDMNR